MKEYIDELKKKQEQFLKDIKYYENEILEMTGKLKSKQIGIENLKEKVKEVEQAIKKLEG